ncbi:YhfC family glutamic-type intramembrane protease [Mobilicoccus pelagius]|uniref:YhfC family intramembrane metalloprotease n=1 Tax=Mobilicoccus pelagius NBRC 104925 TaxID=1089455 RepID=H5UTC9_9MICO|nr:YhfC family glutamic-type intramembrane protease [Mobilicoccus pelagius]GAB48987.1 hypothetical protein MOPEL_094_00040 [Mobilicoccus pelagius NBRC 104925]
MDPVMLLVGRAVLVVLLVGALWVLAARRLPAAWSSIGWGALAFPLSQVARTAFVVPVTLGLTAMLGTGSPALATASVVLAVLTSGLFEEGTRWVVLRWWAKRARSWREGVAFGLGHGGIEAVILLVVSAVNGVVLLGTADAVRGSVATATPEQLPALDAQIAAIRDLTLGSAALGLWERVPAIVVHVACTLLVLQAVRDRRPLLLLAAMVLHCALNAVAVGTAQVAGPVVVELALTAVAAVLLWAVLAGPLSRRRVDARVPHRPVPGDVAP